MRKRVKSLKATSGSARTTSLQPAHEGVVPRQIKFNAPQDAVRELDRAKDGFAQIKNAYRGELDRLLAEVYAVALHLRKNEPAWTHFTEQDAWQAAKRCRPGPRDRKHALRFVMRYVIGFGKGQTKRASKYTGALTVFFRDEVPAEDIPRLVREEGGYERLARANATRSRGTQSHSSVNRTRISAATPEVASQLDRIAEGQPLKARVVIERRQGALSIMTIRAD